MDVSLQQAADFFKNADNIYILAHKNPDGDTIGSAYGLWRVLTLMGKRSKVLCSDPFGSKYSYITDSDVHMELEPQNIVAVDIADSSLLGSALAMYADRVDLCIDHHPSNSRYAKNTLLVPKAAATAEIIFALSKELIGETKDLVFTNSIFTGISTDTGCFRYSNVTPNTHRCAADLMEAGAQAATINRLMFDVKTLARIELERLALAQMSFHFDHRCAVMPVTRQMILQAGADDSELEGVATIPRQIEGVEVGITLRERMPNVYKVSVRTSEHVDASEVCHRLGGGGHARAAGCEIEGTTQEAIDKMLSVIKDFIV